VARCQGLQDQFLHVEPASPYAFDDVLRGTHSASHNVNPDLQSNPAHPDGPTHVLLPINNEFLGQYMQNLLVRRNCDGRCRLNDTLHIGLSDLLVLDGHHSR